MKRKFVYMGSSKRLTDIPPRPPEPTFAEMWREHTEVLSKLFATCHSFYGWAQRYHYDKFPTFEKVISDRVIQNPIR